MRPYCLSHGMIRCIFLVIKFATFVIVEKDEERMELLKAIDRIYSSKITQDELLLLRSRVLTASQIKEDF